MQTDLEETRFKPIHFSLALLSLVTLGGLGAYSMGYIDVQAIKESASNIVKQVQIFCSALGTYVAWCFFWDKGFYPRRIWKRVTSLAITMVGLQVLVLPQLPFGREYKPPIHKTLEKETSTAQKMKSKKIHKKTKNSQ